MHIFIRPKLYLGLCVNIDEVIVFASCLYQFNNINLIQSMVFIHLDKLQK